MGQDKVEKKRAKAEAKARKKQLAAEARRPAPAAEAPSASARFADTVRGALYVLLGASLLLALVLGQRDVVVSLDDLIHSLFLAVAGKIVLAVIGLALAIYGLRKLGALR